MGDGPGTGVRQRGPCSGVGEAGRPSGQRHSVMTAAAVGIGGLAGTVARPPSVQVSSVVRASGRRHSECIFHRHYVRPSVPTQNERRAGGVGEEAPNLPSHLAVPMKDFSEWRTSLSALEALCDYALYKSTFTLHYILGNCIHRLAYMCAVSEAMWCMYAIRYVGRTAIYTLNVRPLTLKPTLRLYDLLWTCSCCAVFDLVFVQNCERRRFGWRAARL